jgi:hypothetical protein
VKPRLISNQPTYKPTYKLRSYKFNSHSHILHNVYNNIEIRRSLKHKVIKNHVHNKVAEANSLKTTQTHLVQIQFQVIVMSNKSIR